MFKKAKAKMADKVTKMSTAKDKLTSKNPNRKHLLDLIAAENEVARTLPDWYKKEGKAAKLCCQFADGEVETHSSVLALADESLSGPMQDAVVEYTTQRAAVLDLLCEMRDRSKESEAVAKAGDESKIKQDEKEAAAFYTRTFKEALLLKEQALIDFHRAALEAAQQNLANLETIEL